MLKWLLVLMALGVVWTSSVQGVSFSADFDAAVRTSTIALPSDSGAWKVPGRVTAWLFQNADAVPQPRVQAQEDASVLTAGVVSKALPARSNRASKPWQPPASAVWLLAAFGGLLVAVALAAAWRMPSG